MSACLTPLLGGVAIVALQISVIVYLYKDDEIKDQKFKYFWQKFFFLEKNSLEGYPIILQPIVAIFMVILFFLPLTFAVMQCIFCKVFKKINA